MALQSYKDQVYILLFSRSDTGYPSWSVTLLFMQPLDSSLNSVFSSEHEPGWNLTFAKESFGVLVPQLQGLIDPGRSTTWYSSTEGTWDMSSHQTISTQFKLLLDMVFISFFINHTLRKGPSMTGPSSPFYGVWTYYNTF